jgi:hypothetical protein
MDDWRSGGVVCQTDATGNADANALMRDSLPSPPR